MYACNHLPGATLSQALNEIKDLLAASECVFVALDSSRAETFPLLRPKLESALHAAWISNSWGHDHFWVSGIHIPRLLQTNILVPYSALYIFPDRKADLVGPYTATSESDNFSDGAPQELLSFLARSRATAFLADGEGLNFCAEGDLANRLIRFKKEYESE
jgi:hypothetical protein